MSETPIVLIHNDEPDAAARQVREAQPDVTVAVCNSYAGLADALALSRASVVYSVRFAGTPGFPRAALVENSSIRWVAVGGSGTDHLGKWDSRAVTLTNSAGVAADMMAEYALGAALHFSLGFDRFRAAQLRHEWTPGKVTPIAGRTALVIGLGHTGQAAARCFKAMGLTVIGLRARPQPTEFVDEVHGIAALARLMARADLILVAVPLLPATRGLLDAAALARLKPCAVLVDVSRGGVVVEAALIEALEDGRLAGAALDVFETEPLPDDNPLWGQPNVIVTPHCASDYDGWAERSVALFIENLARFRKREALVNVVDPGRGY